MNEKRYIIEFHGKSDPLLIKRLGGKVRHDFKYISEKLSATLSPSALKRIEKHSSVKDITEVTVGGGSAQDMSWGYWYTKVDTRYRGKFSGKGIKVAIVDTGMAAHSDLIPPVDFIDFVGSEEDQYDDNGHGTFIAGIIAGQDNTMGYIGVAPNVSIYVAKVLDSQNRGFVDDFVAGIEWAISKGVNIINLSITTDDWNESTIVTACRHAQSHGIIVVACSGNGTLNNFVAVSQVCNPAKDDSCIAVGALSPNPFVRAYFSNYGEGLDVVAPGHSLYSTWNDGGYKLGMGTSYAVAYAVGHLACLMERYPSYSASLIRSRFIQWCDGCGNKWEYGAGCIQAEAVSNAKLELATATPTGCDWRITGLDSIWDDGKYDWCCISLDPDHISGSSDAPSDIVDTQNAPTNGTVNRTSIQTMVGVLTPNTPYTLYAYCKAFNDLWYPAGSAQITTLPGQPVLGAPQLVDGWGTVTGISIELAAVPYANRYYAICNGEQKYATYGMFTWSGLQSDTLYNIEYWAVDTTGACLESAHTTIQIWTAEKLSRPSTFSWSWASYGIPGTTKDPNKIIYVTAEEWNDFTQNIYDIWDYKGYPPPDPPIYVVVKGDRMMADDINPVITAIDTYNPTGIVAKNSGEVDDILPEDFNTLVTKLNGII